MPELLAPCGSYDCVAAAVQSGADAVYLGLKAETEVNKAVAFNARAGAENLTPEQFKAAQDYAHIHGVKVYVALNTLVRNDEIEKALEIAEFAVREGADALIVQDIGLAAILLQDQNRSILGTTEIHASTQMTVYNKEGLEMLKKMGFSRCITARELSLRQIKELCESNIMPIECFCHGALCMSVSGQCLMSSLANNIAASEQAHAQRSGNRGTCAQSCRLPYSIYATEKEKEKENAKEQNAKEQNAKEQNAKEGKMLAPRAYRLSPSDLCSLPYLRRLVDTGVASIKIEGRLKSPEYVALVTRKYRKMLDAIAENASISKQQIQRDVEEMQTIFSRGSFSSGHQLGRMPLEDVTYTSPGRTGLECGKAKSVINILTPPASLPKSLRVYEITVETKRELHCGDGVTFTCGEKSFGGTINKVSKNRLLIAGSLPDEAAKRILAKKPEDFKLYLTLDKQLIKKCQELIKSTQRQIGVSGHVKVKCGEKAELTLNGITSITVTSDEVVQRAENIPLTEGDIYKQLSKLGGTPFKLESLTVDIDKESFIPLAALNSLRRKAVAALQKTQRAPQKKAQIAARLGSTNNESQIRMFDRCAVFLYGIESMQKAREYRDKVCRVYLPYSTDAKRIDKVREYFKGAQIIAAMPYINIGKAYEGLQSRVEDIAQNFDGVLLTNIGDMEMIGKKRSILPEGFIVCGDYSLQIQNGQSAQVYAEQGVKVLTCSPELEMAKARELAKDIQKAGAEPEVIVSGHVILMRMCHCIIAGINSGAGKSNAPEKCGICSKYRDFMLKDDAGRGYPILCDKQSCHSFILGEQKRQELGEKSIFVPRINIL